MLVLESALRENLSLYFSEPSDSETRSRPFGRVCRYSVLTSLTTKITRSLSILESLKGTERRLQRFFFVMQSLESEKA